jgi:hypothetical protein
LCLRADEVGLIMTNLEKANQVRGIAAQQRGGGSGLTGREGCCTCASESLARSLTPDQAPGQAAWGWGHRQKHLKMQSHDRDCRCLGRCPEESHEQKPENMEGGQPSKETPRKGQVEHCRELLGLPGDPGLAAFPEYLLIVSGEARQESLSHPSHKRASPGKAGTECKRWGQWGPA